MLCFQSANVPCICLTGIAFGRFVGCNSLSHFLPSIRAGYRSDSYRYLSSIFIITQTTHTVLTRGIRKTMLIKHSAHSSPLMRSLPLLQQHHNLLSRIFDNPIHFDIILIVAKRIFQLHAYALDAV
jgi:hypothetical protein